MVENQKSIVSGLFWKVLENGGSQGVQFVVSILLARILTPKEYSILALIMIFITIANVLVQNGFGTALIQKKEADERDFSSVFFLSLLVALLIYGIIYAISPVLANFYRMEILNDVLRVMGIVVFPGAIISIQYAIVARKMEFRKLFFSTLVASVLSGIISIFMATKGFGVWALVYQQIVYYITLMLMLFLTVKWTPKWILDGTRLKNLFGFGWKLLVASLIDTIFTNIQSLVMGRIYSDDTLGNYYRGEQFPKLIVQNISAAIQSVMLPVMSMVQDNRQKVRDMLKNAIMMSSFLVLPMMAGLFGIADNLVYVLLGEKWSGSVIFLRLMCIAYSFWPIHIANLQALNAIGRSDVFLKLEIIKKTIGVAVLFIGMTRGAVFMIALKAFADFLCTFVNAAPNKRLLNYSIVEQWKDLLPSVVISLMMGAAVYFAAQSMQRGWTSLLLQMLLGGVLYVVLAVVSKNRNLQTLLNLMRKK